MGGNHPYYDSAKKRHKEELSLKAISQCLIAFIILFIFANI